MKTKMKVNKKPSKPRNEVVRGLIERGQSGAGRHKNKGDYERGTSRRPKHRKDMADRAAEGGKEARMPTKHDVINSLARKGVAAKDAKRIDDMIQKSRDDQHLLQLAQRMANAIGGYAKAYRRALAAESVNFHDVAAIFYDRFEDLYASGKKAADRVAERWAALVGKLWLVHDPSEHTEWVDMVYETTTRDLALIIRGAGRRWDQENVAFHDDKRSAEEDGLARLRRFHKGNPPVWVFKSGGPSRRASKSKPYSGNPDGKPIYPVSVDHGDTEEPLAGGHDVMRRVQNKLLEEQGKKPRPRSPEASFRLRADSHQRAAHRVAAVWLGESE
jgi:hypothetical protein